VIDDLVVTLRDVLRQPLAWQRRGLAGRRLVEERYSWSAKIAAAEVTYREILVERALSCC
jgi:glycosyltransferase involved in cell wall biosynthesis